MRMHLRVRKSSGRTVVRAGNFTQRKVRFQLCFFKSSLNFALVRLYEAMPVYNNRRPHWSSDLLPQFCDACMTFAHLYVLCLTQLCRCIPFGQSEPGQSETQLWGLDL